MLHQLFLKVARMTQAQSHEQQSRLEEVRKNFEAQISQAIEEEKTKNKENIENALEGLRAQLEKGRREILDAEEKRLRGSPIIIFSNMTLLRLTLKIVF